MFFSKGSKLRMSMHMQSAYKVHGCSSLHSLANMWFTCTFGFEAESFLDFSIGFQRNLFLRCSVSCPSQISMNLFMFAREYHRMQPEWFLNDTCSCIGAEASPDRGGPLASSLSSPSARDSLAVRGPLCGGPRTIET